METYVEMVRRHQKEFSELPVFFAFNNEQFSEGMKKFGVQDKSEVISINYGGYVKKTDAHLVKEFFSRCGEELKTARKNREFAVGMFKYELGNHEYCVTRDLTEVINALGLTFEEIAADKELTKALIQAREEYMKEH